MIEKIKEAVQTINAGWETNSVEIYDKNYEEALEVLIKSAEAWEKVIDEIKSLVEYGDTVCKTDNNIGCQAAYKCTLEVINKHLESEEE